MGHRSQISSEQRTQILILRKEGYSLREFAEKMGFKAMGCKKPSNVSRTVAVSSPIIERGVPCKLCASMPRRIEAVLHAKGWPTRY